MTRDEILGAVRQAHADFLAVTAGIPEDAVASQVVTENWTLKDLLGHIAAWYQVATNFLHEFQREGAPRALGLSDDAAVNAFNARAAEQRRGWSLAQVRAEFDAAFAELAAEADKLTDAQLNAPLAAPWEQGMTLERLIAWNSYEHLPEHTEQVKAKSEKPKAESGKRKVESECGATMKDELLAKLMRNRDELLGALADLTEEQITAIPVVGEWTIKDAVGHIAYWEQVIHDHVREAYAEGKPRPMRDGETDEIVNPREVAKRKDRSWQRVRAEFESTRRALIERVESLSEADLSFVVPNPWWNENRFYAVAQMIEEDAVGHCREHTAQVKTWKAKTQR